MKISIDTHYRFRELCEAATTQDRVLDAFVASLQEVIAKLPPPPPGYYYVPAEIVDVRHEGERYIIDGKIELKPIIEPVLRPTASERLDLLRARIRDAVKGYDPFRVRTRNAKAVAWRQCVYLLLKNEGYTLHAIADASGYNHATIAWGIKHAKDLVDIGDSEYKRIWNELNYIDEGWR